MGHINQSLLAHIYEMLDSFVMFIELWVKLDQVLHINHGVFEKTEGSSIGFRSFDWSSVWTIEEDGLSWCNLAELFICEVLSLQVNQFLEELDFILFYDQSTSHSIQVIRSSDLFIEDLNIIQHGECFLA